MGRQLLVATRNRDKLREIQEKLGSLGLTILSLADFPFIGDVVEDRPDLRGNALKKAEEVWAQAHVWTLSDDTGLEVDALGGAPGVFSARYAGPGATYASNCEKLLREMTNVPDNKRTARFKTILCLKTDSGLHCVEGKVEGTIGREQRGGGGFGYDPIFITSSGKTLAEMSLVEKNRISHRGQALDRMKSVLAALLTDNHERQTD